MNTPDSNHPITPTDKLLYQWCAHNDQHATIEEFWEHIATQAAQWGADQRGAVNEAELQKARDEELEACCEWLYEGGKTSTSNRLRDARRPNPSLKEQALHDLEALEKDLKRNGMGFGAATIRRALEGLDD
jgi:hypothetical protein